MTFLISDLNEIEISSYVRLSHHSVLKGPFYFSLLKFYFSLFLKKPYTNKHHT